MFIWLLICLAYSVWWPCLLGVFPNLHLVKLQFFLNEMIEFSPPKGGNTGLFWKLNSCQDYLIFKNKTKHKINQNVLKCILWMSLEPVPCCVSSTVPVNEGMYRLNTSIWYTLGAVKHYPTIQSEKKLGQKSFFFHHLH